MPNVLYQSNKLWYHGEYFDYRQCVLYRTVYSSIAIVHRL